MAEKTRDVASICNALVDILVDVEEETLKEFGLRKGIMHLVGSEEQNRALAKLKDHTKTVELGGSSLNAIRALAALDLKTFFAGCVANDSYGNTISERMSALKIDFDLGRSTEPTGTCLILITPDGERTMLTHLGASRLYTHAHIPFEEIAKAKVFHFAGYQWDTEDQKHAILKALNAAKNAGTLISFDVADPFVVEKHRQDFKRIMVEYADVIFANREEARLLFDNAHPEDAIREMAGEKRIAVIKLGGDGALAAQGNKSVKIAPVKTTVIDTTAAGDMFAGGFLYGLVRGLSLEECGKIAATLAADVISRVGATLSTGAIDRVRR